MKTKLAGLLAGALACTGTVAAPLDYNHVEAGVSLTVDDDFMIYGLEAEANKRFGEHFFAEADLSYGIIDPDDFDDVDVLSFGVGGGAIITLPADIELALSLQFDWTQVDGGTTETSRNVEAELDIPVAENLTVEINMARTFQEEDRDAIVYVGLEGGNKGALQWEGGITRTIDVDGDDEAVHGILGRVVIPVGAMGVYVGAATDLDDDDSDAVELNAGVRIDL